MKVTLTSQAKWIEWLEGQTKQGHHLQLHPPLFFPCVLVYHYDHKDKCGKEYVFVKGESVILADFP